ncbi:hypothetical protein AB0395_12785 [Streptosporangium sp. NPDC051023]
MTAVDTGPFGALTRFVTVEAGGLLEHPLVGTGSTVLTAALG